MKTLILLMMNNYNYCNCAESNNHSKQNYPYSDVTVILMLNISNAIMITPVLLYAGDLHLS